MEGWRRVKLKSLYVDDPSLPPSLPSYLHGFLHRVSRGSHILLGSLSGSEELVENEGEDALVWKDGGREGGRVSVSELNSSGSRVL